MNYSYLKKIIVGTLILTTFSIVTAIGTNKGIGFNSLAASVIYSSLISIFVVGYYETVYNEVNFEKGKISGFYLGVLVALILHSAILRNLTDSMAFISVSYLFLAIVISQISPRFILFQKIDSKIYQHISKLRRIRRDSDES